MRILQGLLIGSLLVAQSGTLVKGAFGLIEGGSSGAGFYRLFRTTSGSLASVEFSMLTYGGRPLEPYGNDLAYDSVRNYLFLIGGGPSPMNYQGIIYGMNPWPLNLILSDSLTGPIGARRLAVKDTLLLVTRNQPPFFTAYRIRPTSNGMALDSLWSPSSPYLRSVPDAIVVVEDTAFIPLSYDPDTYTPDSLILAINLRTMQVDSFCKVYPNPSELVRIGTKLYAACYGDFSVPLHISEVDIATRSVTVTNTGVGSYGGFAADTGGRDTILFVDNTNQLRAYDVTNQQVASSAYQGIQGLGGLSLYGLLWVGDWLITGHTNYTDTLIVVLTERGRAPEFTDTLRLGGIPSLRRLVYAEEDASVLTQISGASHRPREIWIYPNPVSERFWVRGEGIRRLVVRDLRGSILRAWEPHSYGYEVFDFPAGLYLLQIETDCGWQTLRLQKL